MITSNTADLSKLRIDRQRKSPRNTGRTNRRHVILFAGLVVAAVSAFLFFSRGALSSDMEALGTSFPAAGWRSGISP